MSWKAEQEPSHRMKIGKQERKSERDLSNSYYLDLREKPDPILKASETNADETIILLLREERTSSLWE